MSKKISFFPSLLFFLPLFFIGVPFAHALPDLVIESGRLLSANRRTARVEVTIANEGNETAPGPFWLGIRPTGYAKRGYNSTSRILGRGEEMEASTRLVRVIHLPLAEGWELTVDSSLRIPEQDESNNTFSLRPNRAPRLDWERGPLHYRGSDLAVDTEGNVYVIGTFSPAGDWRGNKIWLAKWNPEGELIWERMIDGEGDHNHGYGITIDPEEGLLYVVGTLSLVSRSRLHTDIWVAKYNLDGLNLWSHTYGGPDWDDGYGVAIGSGGDLYVTGVRSEGSETWWTAKLGPADGSLIWDYSLVGGDWVGGQAIDVDRDGNAYVCSSFPNFDGNTLQVMKLGWMGGEPLWMREYERTIDSIPGRGYGECGMALNPEKVCLTSYATVWGEEEEVSRQAWVSCLNYDGSELWSQTTAGPSETSAEGREITFDSDGNLYVVGVEYLPSEGSNLFFKKLDPFGNELWQQTYRRDVCNIGNAIALDQERNIYVTGYSTSCPDPSSPESPTTLLLRYQN